MNDIITLVKFDKLQSRLICKELLNKSDYTKQLNSLPEIEIKFLNRDFNYINSLLDFNFKSFSELTQRVFRKINWITLIQDQKLSEVFIENFQYYVSWPHVFKYQILSETLIKKHAYPYINIILEYQTLSEDFIKSYVYAYSKNDWYIISQHQALSEEFIERYIRNMDWRMILKYQSLSLKFIIKHKMELGLSDSELRNMVLSRLNDSNELNELNLNNSNLDSSDNCD